MYPISIDDIDDGGDFAGIFALGDEHDAPELHELRVHHSDSLITLQINKKIKKIIIDNQKVKQSSENQ